jgi:cytidylate kinase
MSVITVSRQFGSGGDEVVEKICKDTGYQLFDKHLLAHAAYEAGISEKEIIAFSEENFKVKNLFDRLFRRTYPAAQLRSWKENSSGVRATEAMTLDEGQTLMLVQNAIKAAYRQGDLVIVGRGGQVLLADKPDVLHVRIEAPLEDRILRVRNDPRLVSHTSGDPIGVRRTAQDLIEANDAASAAYLKQVYGVDWADPLLYDLTINTSKLGPVQAARIIVKAARKLEPAPQHV